MLEPVPGASRVKRLSWTHWHRAVNLNVSVREAKKRLQSVTHRQIQSVLHNFGSSLVGLAPNTSGYPAAFRKVNSMYNIYQLIISGAVKTLEFAPGIIIPRCCVPYVYLLVTAGFMLLPQLPLVLCWFGSRILSAPPFPNENVEKGTRWVCRKGALGSPWALQFFSPASSQGTSPPMSGESSSSLSSLGTPCLAAIGNRGPRRHLLTALPGASF